MKYMLLIYSDEKVWTDGERAECMAESTELCHELQAKGQFLAASPLHSVASATSLRIRNGKKLITDGPFAETTEQLGGYYIIDVKNLDEAIAIASRLPPAQKEKGTVEIRPIFELDNLPVPSSFNSNYEGEKIMTVLETVKKAYDAWESKDIEALRSLLHKDYKAKMPGGMEIVGIEGAKECLEMCPFEDARSENDIYVAEGDRVVRIWDMVATKPHNVRLRMAELNVVKDGKVIFNEAFFDSAAFPKELQELCEQTKEKFQKQAATTGKAKS